MNREDLLAYVQNRFAGGAPAESPGDAPLPGEEGEVVQETASFAQDALQVAQDPGMDDLRFDPSVLFPEG